MRGKKQSKTHNSGGIPIIEITDFITQLITLLITIKLLTQTIKNKKGNS